uniref:Grh/CP2 DB domain-containing protein n=1 Tax=Moschus moschiferus TaxID=68415 RepID=A0A8C6EH99_MOSMO
MAQGVQPIPVLSSLRHSCSCSLSKIQQCLPLPGREALPLPYLKQEELANIPRVEQPCPTFQYVLCAATSTAVKQQEEALTYLNQGQSYELRMLCNPKLVDATPEPWLVVHVVFHDRHLQFTEQQQLDEWRWSRPGDRILDIDIPLSVGVLEPRVLPSQLDTVEFYWDLTKKTSLFLQVHCISTEFTPRKKGGEKGVPFRLQIDTFKPSDKELPLEHLHSAGCLVKVFKVWAAQADWKLKTDREKIQKQTMHERNKHQTASESTVFMEVCVPGRGVCAENILIEHVGKLRPQVLRLLQDHQHPHIHTSDSPFPARTNCTTYSGWYPLPPLLPHLSSPNLALSDFAGTDLLKLTRHDLTQICGAFRYECRLFSWPRPIRHRLTFYVAQEASRQDDEVPKNPDSGEVLASSKTKAASFYQEISLDELSAVELLGKLAELLAVPANQIHRLFHQGPRGILILLSDQVVQNLKDESYFVAVVKKRRGFRGRGCVPGRP